MTCFDEDQSAEVTLDAADFAQMCDEMEALRAELAALKAPPKVLSADEVKEEGWYRWSDHLHEFSEIVEIVEDADWDTGQEILVMLRVGHIGCCSLRGQFIGPIKMPEV